MHLTPYVSVNNLPFTTTAADLRRRFGPPVRVERNSVGLNELDYGEAVYRFQDNGRLEEITVRAPVLHLGAVAVPFAALPAFVREHDPAAFRVGAFLVSPSLGIAFDPADSNWVTALAAHCLAEWRALASR